MIREIWGIMKESVSTQVPFGGKENDIEERKIQEKWGDFKVAGHHE